MPSYDSGRVSTIGGLNIKPRRTTDLDGIRFHANRAQGLPTSANDFILFRHGNALKVWDGTSTIILVAGGAVGGGAPSWETLFAGDTTFNVAGTTWTIDNSTGNNDVLTVTNTGTGSGDCIQITNVGTGNDIQGTSNTWKVTKAGVATFAGISISGTSSALATTGAAVWTLLDNSSTSLRIGSSGSTAMITFDTSDAAPTVAFGNALTVSDGLATFISSSNTVQNVLVTNNTATTWGNGASSAGVVVVRSTTLTTGVLLRLQATEGTFTTSGFYLVAHDATAGGTNVFTISRYGATTILGTAAGTAALTLTNGNIVVSSGAVSITRAGDAVNLTVTNNTATTASVITIAGSGIHTGTTTTSFMTIAQTGATAGTTLYITGTAATTSVAVVDIAAAALTSGSALRITPGSATFTTGGKCIEIDHGSAVAGNGITVTTTGAYTGTGMVLLTAGAATTGILLSLVSTTGLTSGSLIRATSSTAGALITNGAISLTATGAFTSNSAVDGGFVEVKANSTTAGTIVNVRGTALTTGIALQLSNATSAMTTGSLLRVTASGTGTIATNGIVSITHGGIYASTSAVDGGLLDVRASATTAGVIVNVVGVGLITGVGVSISNGTAATTTGSLLRIAAGGTGAVATNGIVSFTHTGIYTSTTNVDGGFVEIKAAATTAGVITNIVGAGLITGVALSISNGTAATTTGSLLLVQAGGTGAVSGNGIVSLLHTGIYTSTTVGFVNVNASATTAGTVMTITGAAVTGGTGLQISNVAITSGKHLNILGAAGASMFSVSVNGATVITGQALGTAALTLTNGDVILSAGNVKAVGGITTSAPTGLGLGYATGAGGTVTQITNRSTGVTLNTLCGKIQTDTTSLAAGASAEFTFTNSTIAIGDVVVVSQRSGSSTVAGVAGTTVVEVVTVAAGSCIISVNNNSSTTAETGAIIINFAVIKAVTA